jgi:hypothetical protein
VSGHGDPWTDFELQCLYDVINDLDWFQHASRLITRRSPGAIRTKMNLLREEAGIVVATAQKGPRARSRRVAEKLTAEQASSRLLQRLIEVHAPPSPPEPRPEVQLAFLVGPLFDAPASAPSARQPERQLEVAA